MIPRLLLRVGFIKVDECGKLLPRQDSSSEQESLSVVGLT